ncbi:hypothetical protein V1477_015217 [Vespula maculifrons]|uniref:Uncharacterized protein n=1 Tax=Vespula maculifrons TaxID=7453 RepID=A0ABD2BJP1_VESMC
MVWLLQMSAKHISRQVYSKNRSNKKQNTEVMKHSVQRNTILIMLKFYDILSNFKVQTILFNSAQNINK